MRPRPLKSAWSTPASTLLLRSGLSDGLSVKAISNASGGRMPVPAEPRIFVKLPSLDVTNHAAETFGFADTTVSLGNGGRGENASASPSSDSRVMRSTRTPPVTNSRAPWFHRASPKRPTIAAFDRDENVAGGGDECAAGALAEEIDARRGIEARQDRHVGLSAPGRSPRVRLGITERARELAVEAHVRRFGAQSYTAEP